MELKEKAVKAVIFDLDGTLLNTLGDLQNITNHTLHAHGYRTLRQEDIKRCVGFGPKKMIEMALPEDVKLSEEAMQALYEEHMGNFHLYSNLLSRPYDGVVELMQAFQRRGILNIIVSNKMDGPVHTIIEKYFPGLIAAGVGARDDLKLKPHPDMVMASLEGLGIAPEECVYVGDSEVDIKTGINAGMEPLSVTWGFRTEEFLKESGAVHIIREASEIYYYVTGEKL